MHHYFEATAEVVPESIALEWEGGSFTYAELERRANQLANHLIAEGYVTPGVRVGLFLERSPELYVALLAAQKAGAVFVPIDPQSPQDRLEYFVEDAELVVLLTSSMLRERVGALPAPSVYLDLVADELAHAPVDRPALPFDGDDADITAYIIYTSGSSGRPKGVDVRQPSICNFIHVITELYEVLPSDRVYQGMTISFDFAIEEVWPTWATGATIVAGPTDGRRVGEGLTRFLEDRRITLLLCVPTVLSTVERQIPSIRALMVGGEACPAELVARWSTGRRMLNTYGPTETTVTCTVGELHPGKPVTIGVPVPTYTAVILDENRQPVPDGQDGELAIGGIGVAAGYLNRPDLTADRFIPHPTDPSRGRIYRTGDLARIDEHGEIVYLGRADAEVKIRGHRVDLGEIESVMMRDPQVPTAAVKHLRSGASGDELAAYLVLAEGAEAGEVFPRIHAAMRDALPPYMVPAFMERSEALPMLPSGKVDRKALPDPTSTRIIGGDGEIIPPATPEEEWVRTVWAHAFGLAPEALSVTADFFADLSGHSLVAAGVTSALRRDSRGASLSVMDLYANPTVRGLAEHVALRGLDDDIPQDEDLLGEDLLPTDPPRTPSTARTALFGAAQAALVILLTAFTFLPVAVIYWWHDGVPSALMLQHLVLTFPLNYLTVRWVLPLATARIVGHGLREGAHPLYGLTHLRVWLVEKAMGLSPLTNLAGSAFAPGYLRLAGADVHEEAHIGTTRVPLPTMVRVGAGASVGYASHLAAYAVRDGRLVIGRVVVESDATVAAQAVLPGPCELGPRSYLGPQSTLRPGQLTGPDEVWTGSPATRQESQSDPALTLMASCDRAPRTWSPALRRRFVAGLVALEFLPLAALLPVVVVVWWVLLVANDGVALAVTFLTGPVFVATACGLILWLRRFGLPRTPLGVRHLRSGLGVDKWFADKLLESSLLLTNTLYATLYTPPWLRRLGARIGRGAEVSTIANIDPDLLTIGEESFVADMANIGGATYCHHHVAFRPTEVGRRAFVGNASLVPSGTDLGDGSLLGVGSVPPAGGVPEGTSWLGSPAIYLPRREVYEGYGDAETFHPGRRRVVERYLIEFARIVAPSTLLALSTFATLWLTSLVAAAGTPLWLMLLTTPLTALACAVGTVLVVAATKWVVAGRYRPRVEPLWSRFVRRTEFVTGLYEGAAVPVLLQMLTGTPMLGPVLRLFGVRVGRRALLNTTYMTEFDLVHLGDDVYVGTEVSLQTHLFEDRVMKMNVVEVGDRAEVGMRSVVLYSTHVGDDARLSPLSLVMKGESLPEATRWSGIPAQETARAPRGVRS
ncbi:putative non-ribosomal peptide synthetase [Mobilicoccus pelagius NBRC 104925]|uniref:Putative non-ribosomal peptide synthetase n=2 Tax=Mobilicoccus TaxID=984996 RepID=H5UVB3_9MICO|nr:putative non-ribosomal peptide synthetase [Mobilicoccus pelagius NBRC 104925]